MGFIIIIKLDFHDLIFYAYFLPKNLYLINTVRLISRTHSSVPIFFYPPASFFILAEENETMKKTEVVDRRDHGESNISRCPLTLSVFLYSFHVFLEKRSISPRELSISRQIEPVLSPRSIYP